MITSPSDVDSKLVPEEWDESCVASVCCFCCPSSPLLLMPPTTEAKAVDIAEDTKDWTGVWEGEAVAEGGSFFLDWALPGVKVTGFF